MYQRGGGKTDPYTIAKIWLHGKQQRHIGAVKADEHHTYVAGREGGGGQTRGRGEERVQRQRQGQTGAPPAGTGIW